MMQAHGMETDWNVAAAGDDPLIEVPWADAGSAMQFVDLRVETALRRVWIAAIPEAAGSPPLARALDRLNDPAGLLMTSKCDRWALDAEERAALADALDAPAEAHGWGSYIDVLMAHALPMADFLLHEEWARATARRCSGLTHSQARLELIIRPAQRHQTWGYGLSMYVYGGGSTPDAAEAVWAAALEDCVTVLCAAGEAMLMSPGEASSAEPSAEG